MAQAATLRDVARLAGVSTSTVARVFHNKGYVAEETRRLVEATIEETGYQLNAVAQGLRKQRTLTLGHVLFSISPNPFFAGVALGIEQEAAARGCGVLTSNTQGDPERERQGVQTLIRRRVDAILFTTYADAANVRLAAASGIPVVQVERHARIETHTVTVDNYRGSFAATEHLIAFGHRRIAYAGEPPGAREHSAGQRSGVVEQERVAGFFDAMNQHGLPVDDDLVDFSVQYSDSVRIREVTRRWFALPAGQRPTAIFATCDLLAAGVLQEAYAHGLRVPEDLSVVGFDDTYGSHLTPPLTTVAQPMFEMGRCAAGIAIDQVQLNVGAHGPGASAPTLLHERLATRLIVRSSTGPVLEPIT